MLTYINHAYCFIKIYFKFKIFVIEAYDWNFMSSICILLTFTILLCYLLMELILFSHHFWNVRTLGLDKMDYSYCFNGPLFQIWLVWIFRWNFFLIDNGLFYTLYNKNIQLSIQLFMICHTWVKIKTILHTVHDSWYFILGLTLPIQIGFCVHIYNSPLPMWNTQFAVFIMWGSR